MTNTSHTPGPWRRDGFAVGIGVGPYIAIVSNWRMNGSAAYSEAQANARLIGKAPELFKIVQRLVEMKQGVDKYYGQYNHYTLKLGAEVVDEMSRLVAEIEGE